MTKFDVFVSFRGIDTRRSFVSHLCHSLFKKQIRTFKHDEEERSHNQGASSQVLQCIEESKIVIVVISKNYTTSASCLDELVKIIECKEKGSLVVVPVFYEVDPSEFAERANDLACRLRQKHDEIDNFEKVKMKMRDELVTRWRDSLIELTQIFKNYTSRVEEDSDMIDRVLDYISPHLSEAASSELRTEDSERVSLPTSWSNHLSSLELITMAVRDVRASYRTSSAGDMDYNAPVSVETNLENSLVYGKNYATDDFSSLVGMDRQVKAVETLLQDLDLELRVGGIGICGGSGVGKTTLTTCVYEQISSQFQDQYYFMNDTSNHSLGRKSTCLLEEITRASLVPTSGSESERLYEVVKAKLGHRKVLLIVDDLDHNSKLKGIIKISRWFGTGSRLIIVTKNKNLLLQCEVKHVYEVESLRYDEALQLFSQFAFKQRYIPRGFDQLAVRAVNVTCRLPLALKVFGSFLRGKNFKEWEFELCRLEASQDKCVAEVSSYMRDDERDEFPSYCFA